jgi:hypothetical protein
MMIDKGLNVGDINFPNFLKRFVDMGFNHCDCLSELIDNARDANSNNIHVYSGKDETGEFFIDLVDDGDGMDKEGFKKYFEMFGDKVDKQQRCLGKKGIGGKIALVSLSKVGSCMVISRRMNNHLYGTAIEWSSLQNPCEIVVQKAYKDMEDIWTSRKSRHDKGTLIRVCLPPEVYHELNEIINDHEFDERNIYFKLCRNYFRLLEEGMSVSFTLTRPEGNVETLNCVPFDVLYLREPCVIHQKDELSIYKDNEKWVILFHENDQQVSFKNMTTNALTAWNEIAEKLKNIRHVGNMTIEHSWLRTLPDKDNVANDANNEKYVLSKLFPNIKWKDVSKKDVGKQDVTNKKPHDGSKDKIIRFTCGTHLERNKKETNLLVPWSKKTAGNNDERDFHDTKNRVIFESMSDADDEMDTLFKTQINKSKVDICEMPKILEKVLKYKNKQFVDHLVKKHKSTKTQTIESTPSSAEIQQTPSVIDVSQLNQTESNSTLSSLVKTNPNVSCNPSTSYNHQDSQRPTPSQKPTTNHNDTITKIVIPEHTRTVTPITRKLIFSKLAKIASILNSENAMHVEDKITEDVLIGYTDFIDKLDETYKEYSKYIM